jgi:ketosteroid isomerase-like protein
MMFGTDSDEKLLGWDKIRKAYLNQFNLISDTYISVYDQFIRINCTGNTAWFSESMNYNFIYDSVAHSFEGIRFTGVIEKDDNDGWKLVQGHLSVPAHVNIGKP